MAIRQAPKNLDKKGEKASDKQEPSEKQFAKRKAEAAGFGYADINRGYPATFKVSHTDLAPLKHVKFLNLFYLQYTQLLGIKYRTLFTARPMRFSRLSKRKTSTKRRKSSKSLVLLLMSNCLSLSPYPKKLPITMLRTILT
jgi:hypothetical protein